jgi:hypothetical protein
LPKNKSLFFASDWCWITYLKSNKSVIFKCPFRWFW